MYNEVILPSLYIIRYDKSRKVVTRGLKSLPAEAGGFNQKGDYKNQAEIITRAINMSNNNLVTKADLKASVSELRSEITHVRSEINEVRSDVEKVELKIDSVRSEIGSVRSEVGTLKWMIGLLFALNITTIGLVLNKQCP